LSDIVIEIHLNPGLVGFQVTEAMLVKEVDVEQVRLGHWTTFGCDRKPGQT
jgi:hypothetical protein